MKYEVYTDGACANNQAQGRQPGGWAAVFLDGRTFSGGATYTTNNRMELTAVIEALKNTPKGSKVDVYSDSAYVINAFQQKWIPNWIKKGWKTSQGKPVENQDLWKKLIALEQERYVQWIKVKGHSGNKWNEIADKLAVDAIQKLKQEDTTQKVLFTHKQGEKDTVELHLSKHQYELLLNAVKKLAVNHPMYSELYQQMKEAELD